MTTVNVFNASPGEIILEINDGQPLHVPPTGDTSGWIAQQPDQVVQWSDLVVVPGQFHYNFNRVRMYRPGQDPKQALVSDVLVPSAGPKVMSLQFYVFWRSGTDLHWLLLREGTALSAGPPTPLLGSIFGT